MSALAASNTHSAITLCSACRKTTGPIWLKPHPSHYRSAPVPYLLPSRLNLCFPTIKSKPVRQARNSQREKSLQCKAPPHLQQTSCMSVRTTSRELTCLYTSMLPPRTNSPARAPTEPTCPPSKYLSTCLSVRGTSRPQPALRPLCHCTAPPTSITTTHTSHTHTHMEESERGKENKGITTPDNHRLVRAAGTNTSVTHGDLAHHAIKMMSVSGWLAAYLTYRLPLRAGLADVGRSASRVLVAGVHCIGAGGGEGRLKWTGSKRLAEHSFARRCEVDARRRGI